MTYQKLILVAGLLANPLPCLLHGATDIRAAYCFPNGRAWTASVELPQYTLLDIGALGTPIGVNDAGEVLLRDPESRLIKWTWGKIQVLHEPFLHGQQAFLNENGTVVASDYQLMEKRLLYWLHHDNSPSQLDVASHLVGAPSLLQIYGLNDFDTVVFRADAQENLFFVPDTRELLTACAGLTGGGWQVLSRYTYILHADYSITYGGQVFTVADLNNYGDAIGLVQEGGGSSAPGDSNPDEQAYDNTYFSLNVGSVLEFEPMAMSDRGSVLGATWAPTARLVMLDEFGQRTFGPTLAELDTMRPIMSNPDDGMEEIVIGNHYFKRKSESDLNGNPMGMPSPEFFHGYLGDILSSGDAFYGLTATCISRNGRIAGTGMPYDASGETGNQHAFVMVEPLLIPDWDRNGMIDTFDRKFA